jgi:hypothetical protein
MGTAQELQRFALNQPAPTFSPVDMATTRARPTIGKTNRSAILDKNKSLAKGA